MLRIWDKAMTTSTERTIPGKVGIRALARVPESGKVRCVCVCVCVCVCTVLNK